MILEAQKLHRGDGERRRLVTNLTQGNSPVQWFERQPRRLVQCWLSPQQASFIIPPSEHSSFYIQDIHDMHTPHTLPLNRSYLVL